MNQIVQPIEFARLRLYHPRVFEKRRNPTAKPKSRWLLLLLTVGLIVTTHACRKSPAPATSQPAKFIRPTVASLVPAASDIILHIGGERHLVAISNYDDHRQAFATLPRVGDYQTTDWERITAIKPDVMIRQFSADRVPAGLQERADALGIKLLNLQIETLDDISRAYSVLGEAIGQASSAMNAWSAVQAHLDAIRLSQQGRPRVRSLILIDPEATAVIGPDTFLDELLTIAGGENVARDLKQRYPSIDREMLRKLDPDAIVQLLPGASAQVVESAREMWKTLGHLQAVKHGRVTILTEPYTLLPASRVANVAALLDDAIHMDQASSSGDSTHQP